MTISNSGDWFGNISIPLNSELISVIGPRGSGKSALAELCAFTGGSNLFRNSSDLKDTFLAKASKRSPSNPSPIIGTKVVLKWRDGHESDGTIDSTLRTQRPEEEVKYLPQKFVEWLCAPENNHELEHEIERVIYQRHQKGAQTTASNFQELRRTATQALQTKRLRLSQAIKQLNQSIATKSSQIDELAQKNIDLSRRKAELAAVAKLAPSIPEANRADVARLQALQVKRQALVEKVSQLNHQATLLETIAAKYEFLASDLIQFNRDVAEMYAAAGITGWEDALMNPPPARAQEIVVERRTAIAKSLAEIQGLAEDESENTITGLDRASAAIKARLTLTEAKQKEYEKNRADQQKLEIAIAALEKDIKEINENLIPRRREENQERLNAFLDAIDLLGQESQVLEKLYKPLHDALAKANDTANRLRFISKVVFDSSGQASRGIELFDRRRSTIKDEEDFRAVLAKYFDDVTAGGFKRENTKQSLDSLRIAVVGKTELKDQLREKRSAREFADWLFDIEPYTVTYTLEYDKKDLKYLSPGEKGIVLLLLYLEAEEDDHRPLIIDQPDDNLDNLSIYPNLIAYFRERKLTRQIIIITHNPNLVVTTDSEQIIVGAFDGSRTPRIQYRAGSLEDTGIAPDDGIREEVCRVLEGGITAFQLREKRYAIGGE